MLLIILIIPFALWFWFMLVLRPDWVARLPKNGWGRLADIAICILFMLIPMVDEVVGGFQFRALCNALPPLQIDAAKAKGRVARVKYTVVENVVSIAIPLETVHYIFYDTKTNEEFLKFTSYSVKAGFLTRFLYFGNQRPLMIDPYSCSPEQGVSITKKYKFTITY
jgi:hypothetical protein